MNTASVVGLHDLRLAVFGELSQKFLQHFWDTVLVALFLGLFRPFIDALNVVSLVSHKG